MLTHNKRIALGGIIDAQEEMEFGYYTVMVKELILENIRQQMIKTARNSLYGRLGERSLYWCPRYQPIDYKHFHTHRIRRGNRWITRKFECHEQRDSYLNIRYPWRKNKKLLAEMDLLKVPSQFLEQTS